MKRWALISLRFLAIAGFALCLFYRFSWAMIEVGYGKQVYTAPNPNPIYKEFLAVLNRADNDFLWLSAIFLAVFVLSFFRKKS